MATWTFVSLFFIHFCKSQILLLGNYYFQERSKSQRKCKLDGQFQASFSEVPFISVCRDNTGSGKKLPSQSQLLSPPSPPTPHTSEQFGERRKRTISTNHYDCVSHSWSSGSHLPETCYGMLVKRVGAGEKQAASLISCSITQQHQKLQEAGFPNQLVPEFLQMQNEDYNSTFLKIVLKIK